MLVGVSLGCIQLPLDFHPTETHNIIPYAIMKKVKLECKKIRQSILAIDSGLVRMIRELKNLVVRFHATLDVTIMINIILVDIPPSYSILLERE